MKSAVTKANVMLIFVTLLWGLTFPLIKQAVEYVSPNIFVFVRFSFAALCFIPLLGRRLRHSTKILLFAGLALGVLNSGIYLFQTIGLQTISASRSAFITGVNVLLVPFLLPFFRLGWPRKLDIFAAIISLVGLFILTGANVAHLSIGDLWTLGCAILYALAIVFIQWITPKVNSNYLLSFYQILFALPIIGALSIGEPMSGFLHVKVLIALLFCSLGATVIAFYWQMKYQQQTTAIQAALIYCLEPVFASIFAFFINGEVISKQTLLGGSIVLVGLVLPLLYRYFTFFLSSN